LSMGRSVSLKLIIILYFHRHQQKEHMHANERLSPVFVLMKDSLWMLLAKMHRAEKASGSNASFVSLAMMI
ncbi:hypothetical protein PO124_29890, partial [Bacillus licheniformis]|nr:hypothetical protein [Bacillus licheniformis]